jgi:putative transposase
MPKRKEKFLSGHFYHIYNRGEKQQSIFFERENYLYFLRLLKKFLVQFDIGIICYCLMPNHFHFLLRPNQDDNVSEFMSRLLNAYVKAVNKRYSRSGRLFAERFKCIYIDKESYLIHLCRYIHLNPLKAKLVSNLRDWPFSNYLEFIGLRKGSLFNEDFFRTSFISGKEYEEFVMDYAATFPQGIEKYFA